jgi:hypothetical protein
MGLDLGWETNRTLRTSLGFRPQIVSWLRNDFDWTTVYQSDRNTNFFEDRVQGADTTTTLTRNARAQRDWGLTLGLSPTALATTILGPEDAGEDPGVAQLRGIIGSVRPVTVAYRDGISSRFNREPIDPGARYQFGIGGRGDFRLLDADTAATLTDRESWRIGSGLSLPAGIGIQVNWALSEGQTLDVRSDRRTRLQTWPDVQVRLPTIRLPSFTGIQTVNLTSGYQRSQRQIRFGGRAQQSRFDEDRQIPVDVSVQWLRTLVTTYRGSFRAGRGTDPTGQTERDLQSHRISLSAQLLPPSALARRLDRPVRVSVIGAYRGERDCRITITGTECVAFIDRVTKSASLALDTSAGGFEFGLQLSFDDNKSFVGQRTGSTQFQLGLFGQLDFAAGGLPLGG